MALIERAIPSTGELVPAVGLGTWQVFDVAGDAGGLAQARDTLRTFAELGGRLVDSSPMYGSSEEVTGALAAELGVPSKLFLATKVWTTGRAAGIRQMEESARRLRSSPLDLIQVHNLVDVDAHLATLSEWKSAGRIRYLGITHYHAGAHAELERLIEREPIDVVQINYSVAEPEAGRRVLRAAASRGTAVIVNRPFGQGGVFHRVRGKRLPDWAGALGCESWGQLFLKWILADPAVTCVIPGTRNPAHVRDNLAAASDPLPDEATRARIAAAFGT